jgi:UDP-N-acetylglucosamine/UDP-N-acetylgalactosamine diphosphorylase
MMKSKEDLEAEFLEYGQEHVFRHWSLLSPQEAEEFLDQLREVDLSRCLKAWNQSQKVIPTQTIFEKAKSFDGTNPVSSDLSEYRKLGEEILASGSVAAFTVAGGQGTRLGHDGPKGTIKCTPLSQKSLFHYFTENLKFHSEKYGHVFNWFIMTSKANHSQTTNYFTEEGFFGYPPEKIHFFEQGMIPVFDKNGKILLAKKNKLAMSPDGHGGSLEALKKAGIIKLMAEEDIKYLSYFQVDNPMVNCLDPTFVGLHSYHSSEMSSKAVKKVNPEEKVGTFVSENGKVKVIEYSDLPQEVAQKKDERGFLNHGLGSIAIHILSRSFMEKVLSQEDEQLPFHPAHKAVPCINNDGISISPTEPNGIKLETFIFDALPKAQNSLILEVSREEEFAPIKNKTGDDSLHSSTQLQTKRACRWLDDSKIARSTDKIEISPLYSPSFYEFNQKSEKLRDRLPINQPTVFDENGPTVNF